MRILIAEDDDLLRKSLAFYLKNQGWEVVEKNNGVEVLEALESEAFDALVTDLNMPLMGGLEIIQRIRIDLKSELPIIVLTASGIEKTELEAFQLGASEFLSKPFSPSVLKTRIEKLMKK